MYEQNFTSIPVVFLLGLETPPNIYMLVFLILFLVYCVTICGNLLIIILVSFSKTLHTPMYFFLSQLSLLDILLSSDILPILLSTVLVKKVKISFAACITQLFVFASSEGSECLLLTVMSYDRYLAICRPLHYNLIINHMFCCINVITIWNLTIITTLIYVLILSQLKYCGANVIDHFFCDRSPILQLSCSDTTMIQLVGTVLVPVFIAVPFVFIIISYVYITVTIFKIPSNTGRHKAFSTCSSHLTVVSIYYGSLMCVYLVPYRGQSWNVTRLLALLYTVITPLINPIVYSLRNKDLKKAGRNLITYLYSLLMSKYAKYS